MGSIAYLRLSSDSEVLGQRCLGQKRSEFSPSPCLEKQEVGSNHKKRVLRRGLLAAVAETRDRFGDADHAQQPNRKRENPSHRRYDYCPAAVVSAGAGALGMNELSELNVSTATFHDPSACFFQMVVYLPGSVMVEPSGMVAENTNDPSV